MRKHQVLETFWKEAWAQNGINIHKNLVLEMVWKAYESNMHKVQGKQQVLEQERWTQHESNMRNHAQKPGKTSGS